MMKEPCENLQEELHIKKPTSNKEQEGNAKWSKLGIKTHKMKIPKLYGCAILLNITKDISVHGFQMCNKK
jgi:hypothetical protein